MSQRLKGKIAVVTGAGSGIGEATARLMAREGAIVVLADRAAPAAEAVARDIAAQGGTAEAREVDVGDSAAMRQMIEAVAQRHGRLDVLVNNAGYGIAANVVDTAEDDWARLMRVNVDGVFHGCKYAIPIMRRQGGGAIVNTASAGALVGLRERAAYCASKGAVAALTRAMALDHATEGIRINCVAPGTIESPYFREIYARSADPEALRATLAARQPMNRLGSPEEVARAIVFLASDDASFATGSTLVLDGGLTAA
ncbi:short-chain dehydrogenase [Achromobacter denitrificans]|uniref:SDR family oxidoreductase n=1 Tax=Achromobacter denitrificans TaxID=32002 RepID=UPI000B4C2EC7|nr:SDR family oxidoreductase [Achromobacter denitrificans]ASC63503.1 short-chain dehydrogenase [Achromobacter denitrificans]